MPPWLFVSRAAFCSICSRSVPFAPATHSCERRDPFGDARNNSHAADDEMNCFDIYCWSSIGDGDLNRAWSDDLSARLGGSCETALSCSWTRDIGPNHRGMYLHATSEEGCLNAVAILNCEISYDENGRDRDRWGGLLCRNTSHGWVVSHGCLGGTRNIGDHPNCTEGTSASANRSPLNDFTASRTPFQGPVSEECAHRPGSLPGLQVASGSDDCEIDANGCATDGPGNYGNGERCTIRVNAAGTLTATEFETSNRNDYVTIGRTSYFGSTGPSNVAVAAGLTFTWRSNAGNRGLGWTICLTPTGTNHSYIYDPTCPRPRAVRHPSIRKLAGIMGVACRHTDGLPKFHVVTLTS